jgi:hypothetical protein
MICVFSVHVLTQFSAKIILSYYGYQLNSCKLCVGLTFPMTRIEASTPSLIYLCSNLFSFCRCMMFFFLMQRHRFGLFYLDLVELKSSSFLMSMVSFVIFQSVPFKGIDKRLGKIYMFPSWKFVLEYMISFLEHLNIFTLLFGHDIVRRCPWNYTFVDAQNFHWPICVCLGTWEVYVQQQVNLHA